MNGLGLELPSGATITIFDASDKEKFGRKCYEFRMQTGGIYSSVVLSPEAIEAAYALYQEVTNREAKSVAMWTVAEQIKEEVKNETRRESKERSKKDS